MKLINLTISGVLNSAGKISAKATLYFENGIYSYSSSPSALKAGANEKKEYLFTNLGKVKDQQLESKLSSLLNRYFKSQEEFDNTLTLLNLGANISLALSIAYAKAFAELNGIWLYEYISKLTKKPVKIPKPMINIFSGGIHTDFTTKLTFQQIMIIPNFGDVETNILNSIKIYKYIEKKHKSKIKNYSISGGMIINEDYNTLFDILQSSISELNLENKIDIGFDAASEHFRTSDGLFQFKGKSITSSQLLKLYEKMIKDFNISFIEDPFSSHEVNEWIKLKKNSNIAIIGDDLFSTNIDHIKEYKERTTGILLKMNQIGNLTETLKAALYSTHHDLALYASHRSFETDDCSLIDLATGIGVEAVKIGSPMRERVFKYNRLFEIYEKHIKNE